jgi:predicted ATP-grasp superfamily ATP-dependent carboligase
LSSTGGPIRTDRPAAVIVGLDCITGLQSTRIFAARGIPVVGVAADRNHYCARTRLPVAIVRAPLRGEPLVDALVALGRRLERPGVLVPCTDAAVLAISAGRDRLADAFRFVLPDHADVERLMDKVAFAEHALAARLPIPPTAVLRSRADAERAAETLEFPAVLKPGMKGAAWVAATKAKAIPVDSPAALLAAYDESSAWTDVLIAQSWVHGGEDSLFSANVYYDRDSVERVSFVARKLRQWPLDTGTSCLGEEVRNDEVGEVARALFGSVSYRGLGYVEAKADERTGHLMIIEPNIGRPTGRSAIAEQGGVELLLTAYRDALGEPLPEARVQTYRGVKWIYWRHDVQAAIARGMRGELTPAGWWRSVRGPKFEAVFSPADPVPFAADLVHTAGAVGGAIRRRITRAVRRAAATRPANHPSRDPSDAIAVSVARGEAEPTAPAD